MRCTPIIKINRFQIFMATVKANKMLKTKSSVLWHKSGFRTTFKMPFSNIACLIPCLFHHIGKEYLITAQGKMVLYHSMALSIFACQYTCTKRTTDRIAGIGLGEMHPLLRKPVYIWGFYNFITSAAHGIAAHLVRVDN